MFTTKDLIEQVRDALLEYDAKPITDESILRKLNNTYNSAYNILTKQQDSLFSRWRYLRVTPGVATYTLPKDLFGKRIKKMYSPVPITDPVKPIEWVEILRVDAPSIPRFEMPRFNTYYVGRWTQQDNRILFAPSPNLSTVFRFLVTPRLIRLGKLQGQIVGISGNEITLDEAPDADFTAALNQTCKNILSISDEMTGVVKQLYAFSGISGNTITLANSFPRTHVEAFPVQLCYAFSPASNMTYDPITKVISVTLNSNPTTGVHVGDYIEVTQPSRGGSYNIIDSVETTSDFYDPPEYEVTSEFSSMGIVTAVTSNTLSWRDSTVVPDFVNGYPQGYDATFNGTLIAMSAATLYSNPVVEVTTATVHGLELNKIFKIIINGTGTNCDGTKKCIITAPNKFAILQASFTGVFAGGTWAMYQYSSLVVVTGWPAITDCSPGTPAMEVVKMFAGSPTALTFAEARSDNTPDLRDIINNAVTGKYDHEYDIALGDYVTLGLSTGKPLMDGLFADLLIHAAVSMLKSSVNETDEEVVAFLKEKLAEIRSETEGRDLSYELQTTPFPTVNYPFRNRR